MAERKGRELAVAYVSIVPSADGMAKALETALGKPVEEQAKKSAKSFSDAMAAQGNKLAAAGKQLSRNVSLPLAAGFGVAIKAASDLNETVSKTGVVFGESAKDVIAFGKGAATSIGQSERSALDAASGFGNLFHSIGLADKQSAAMSVQFTKLASDLASFQNTSPEDAIRALSSALVGEVEPIRQYGVLLDDATLKQEALKLGLGDYTHGTLPPAIRAQAAFAAVMDQTKTAQGDFTRTSKGLANQSRILKAQLENTAASIGTKMLPATLNVVKGVSSAVDAFGKLPGPVQTGAVAFAAIAVAAGPVITAIGNVEKAAVKLGPGLKNVGILGGVGFAALAAEIAIVGTQLSASEDKANALADSLTKGIRTNDLQSFIDAQHQAVLEGDRLNQSFGGANANALARFGGAIAATVQVLTPFTRNTLTQHADQLDKVGAKYEDITARTLQLQRTLSAQSLVLGLTTEDVIRLADAYGIDLSGPVQEVNRQLAEAYTRQKAGAGATTGLADAVGTLGSQVASAKDKIDAFNTAVDATVGVSMRVGAAQREVADAERRLSELRARGPIDATKLADAERSLASATSATANARRGLADAEAELARLRAGPTADEAGDADRAVRHADLQVEEAKRRVEDAQAALRHAAKGKEQDDAVLAAQEAELSLADAIDAQNGARKQQQELQDRGKEGSKELTDAEQRVADAKAAVKSATDEQARADAELRKAQQPDPDFQRELADAVDAVVEAHQHEVKALADAGKVNADAAAQGKVLYDQLVNLEQKFPDLTGVVDDYIAALGKIPGVSIPGAGDKTFNAGRGVHVRAAGGPVSAGTPYIVGEHRPELFVPRQAGHVFAHVPPGWGSGPSNEHHWHIDAPLDANTYQQIDEASRLASWRLSPTGRA